MLSQLREASAHGAVFRLERYDCSDALTTANLNLILNALALIQEPSTAPEPGTLSILAAALGGFGFILARRKTA